MSYNPALIKIWLGFSIAGGHVCLPFLIITLYFSKLKRLATLYNMVFTWIFASVVNCMLFYSGTAFQTDPQPSQSLCLAQSSLMYGIPILTSLSLFVLIYDMWNLVSCYGTGVDEPVTKQKDAVLCSIPWIGFLSMVSLSLGVGSSKMDTLNRERMGFFCSIEDKAIPVSLAVLTALTLSATIFYKLRTARKYWAHWLLIKSRVEDPSSAESSIGYVYVAFRIAFFLLYLLVSLSLSMVIGISPNNTAPDVLIGMAPFIIFLTFGLQADVVNVWKDALVHFWSWSLACVKSLGRNRSRPSPFDVEAAMASASPPLTVNTYAVWKRRYLDQAGAPDNAEGSSFPTR